MNCVICKKQALVTLEYKSIEIDYCVLCHGVWLDQGEFEFLLESDGGQKTSCELDKEETWKSRETRQSCPICLIKMDKVLFGSGSSIRLDKCSKDHGFWFDGGELDAALHHSRPSEGGQLLNFLK